MTRTMNKGKAVLNTLNIVIILLLRFVGLVPSIHLIPMRLLISMGKAYKSGEQAYMLMTLTLRLRFL